MCMSKLFNLRASTFERVGVAARIDVHHLGDVCACEPGMRGWSIDKPPFETGHQIETHIRRGEELISHRDGQKGFNLSTSF